VHGAPLAIIGTHPLHMNILLRAKVYIGWPASRSCASTCSASAAGVVPRLRRVISAASGASYGLLMPVKFGIAPAWAFA